jgi:D-ornithine 4,5-aminomutase subunit alpha
MKALAALSDEALYERFWGLTEELASPLVKFAESHTSPSIERSVLLRMGFDSLQAKAFVERCVEEKVIGRGAGAILVRYAEKRGIDYHEAYQRLMDLRNWAQEL